MPELGLDIAPQIFKKTNSHEGWREFFSPETGAMRYLSYARLVFGPATRSHTLETGEREWVLFCIRPSITVAVGGQEFTLGKNDMLYLPRHTHVAITGDASADVVAAGATSDAESAPQLVHFNAIKDDPNFFFDVGDAKAGTRRRIYNMLGHNVAASRLLAGFTVGEPSAWTSWPPHEHAMSKEEFYLFFDMPPPAFSVQFVYSNVGEMEFREAVQDGDCVTIPGGYHPTAAAPGHSSVFLWVMAAYDPAKDRDFKHGIHIQPEFSQIKFV